MSDPTPPPNQPGTRFEQNASPADEASQPDQSLKDLSFEQGVERLEQIIEQIETGEIGIEQALKHYESGTGLIKHCRSILDRAESRITELTAAEDGTLSSDEEKDNDDDVAF